MKTHKLIIAVCLLGLMGLAAIRFAERASRQDSARVTATARIPDALWLATHVREAAALKAQDGKDHTADAVAALIHLRSALNPPAFPALLEHLAKTMRDASWEVRLVSQKHVAKTAADGLATRLVLRASSCEDRAKGPRDFTKAETKYWAAEIANIKAEAGDLLLVLR